MIRINRKPVPAIFESPLVQERFFRAKEFYGKKYMSRSQKQFNFETAVLFGKHQVRAALADTFHRKCGYCETRLGVTGPGEVDHFRPKRDALGEKKEFSRDHYWWLAYSWENLIYSCTQCNRNKGTKFPVKKSRAKFETYGDDLKVEEPLLLDPCSDNPEEHLVYNEDGTVVGVTEQGVATIDILELNRPGLVEARHLALQFFRTKVENLHLSLTLEEYDKQFFVDDKIEYAGFLRQVITSLYHYPRYEVRELEKSEIDEIRARKLRHKLNLKSFYIERIELENFKGIDSLDLKFPESGGDQAPWLMFLGENGAGKSTILQAVALALAGNEVKKLKLGAADFVSNNKGIKNAKVSLTVSGKKITLLLNKKSNTFEVESGLDKMRVLAYGASRLPARRKKQIRRLSAFRPVRIKSLFDPYFGIHDPNSWAQFLTKEQVDIAATALKSVLNLDEDSRFTVRKSGLVLIEKDNFKTLNELSDGYQSMVGTITEIMRFCFQVFPSLNSADCIVLFDEIGLHMHPIWKQRIVGVLRQIFPRLQFITTTHDPLCLKGIKNGEVALVHKIPTTKEVVVNNDLPDVSALRVDEILSSEHFGLSSTTDPELEAKFQEYHRILGKERMSVSDANRVNELKSIFISKQLYGTTERERLLFEVADKYLAKRDQAKNNLNRQKLKNKTVETLMQMWTSKTVLEDKEE